MSKKKKPESGDVIITIDTGVFLGGMVNALNAEVARLGAVITSALDDAEAAVEFYGDDKNLSDYGKGVLAQAKETIHQLAPANSSSPQ